jgi:hypothetical protein
MLVLVTPNPEEISMVMNVKGYAALAVKKI